MSIKEVARLFDEGIKLGGELSKANDMLVKCLHAISKFWLTATSADHPAIVQAGMSEDIKRMSAMDASFSMTIITVMEIGKETVGQTMIEASSNWRLRASIWLMTVFDYILKPSHRTAVVNNLRELNEMLTLDTKNKREAIKQATARLANLQGFSLSMLSGDILPTTSPLSVSLVADTMKEAIEYMEANGMGDSIVSVHMSIDELVEGGLTQDEALEFLGDFSAAGVGNDEQEIEGLVKASKEGNVIGFAMNYLREKHGERR